MNRKTLNRLALAVAVIAICFVLAVGAAAALAPSASPEAVADYADSYGGPGGYFPKQLLGRAGDFEGTDLFE